MVLLSACGATEAEVTRVVTERATAVERKTVIVKETIVEKETVVEKVVYASTGTPMPMTSLAPPNDEPYADVFFDNYGVNPIIDTEDDHLSTFAVDVDTASYTVMRRYLGDGHLPDKDSVRVEEYINYFRQDYAPPGGWQAGVYIFWVELQAGGEVLATSMEKAMEVDDARAAPWIDWSTFGTAVGAALAVIAAIASILLLRRRDRPRGHPGTS